MRIISRTRLVQFWSVAKQADGRVPLERWHDITATAAWKNTADVKTTFGVNVDFVQVKSGRTVAVIHIGGNKYRLIAAIHFQKIHFAKGRVYVLRILDHKEYDKKRWIAEL